MHKCDWHMRTPTHVCTHMTSSLSRKDCGAEMNIQDLEANKPRLTEAALPGSRWTGRACHILSPLFLFYKMETVTISQVVGGGG